ncbi:lon protease homolog 2, peroxisomal-like [Lineus longissimus]|uniref:lon protease homolog 2, peroxisomal-like n=1 Tax=Lineus longissimus TaxID=88925 RepID=UPI002B4D18E3
MASTTISIPRRLPLLQVDENVLLPGSSMRIPVRSHRNMNMVKSRLLGRNTLSSTIIGVIPKEPGASEIMDTASFHEIGTAAVAVQVTGTNWPQPSYTLLVTGLCRFKIEEILQDSPFPIAMVSQLDKLPGEEVDDDVKTSEMTVLIDNFREQALKLVDMLDVSIPVVGKLKKMLDSVPAHHLPDICASIIKASYSERIQVLDAVDLTERFKKTLPLLMRQIEGLKLLQKARRNNIDLVARKQDSSRSGVMRKFFKNSPDLAHSDDDADDIQELEHKIKDAKLPDHALKAATKELKRLKKMPQHMPEHAMIRNYLELMTELPWSKSTTDSLDIDKARNDLDADHYGLEKLKKRVLEYLAVRQLKNSLKGPILCFVGPPGVGKTSVGRSIASTLGREFHRISLGGVHDQSDIRGHRRTYIGSMPGRIVQGLKLVATNNPVFLLDEVDKLAKGLHGDPSAALLEVLDPEQNSTFTDHYLNVPFDLSQVLFIATANTTSSIPAALLDRMEVIQIPGYTHEEKLHIAVRYLVPKQVREHGLTHEQLQIPEDSIKLIISGYTREAGVRSLERKLAAVCRAVAVKVAEHSGKTTNRGGLTAVERKELLKDQLPHDIDTADLIPPELPIVIDEVAVEDILGPATYEHEMGERLSQPGVVIGLAWTQVGGEIMFIEATKMPGEGKLLLTGMLGDVMKESANLALNWVRSHADQLQVPLARQLEKVDIHIHFPAGSVGKDGPSAGVAIVTVLVSLFSGRLVRSDTAMTGEVTLRGLVLPVGGIKEKVLAAHRAGITRVILPKRCEKDVREIPKNVQSDITFIYVSRVGQVLRAAFDDSFPDLENDNGVISKL